MAKTIVASEPEPDPYELYRRIWKRNMKNIATSLRLSVKFGGRRG